MKMRKKALIIAIILCCVLLDLILHAITSAFCTIPEYSDFSILVELIGIEGTAAVWALLAFSVSAIVFIKHQGLFPEKGIKKGFRYGGSIAVLWLLGMLEGVILFNNPFPNEFITGLSDAVPVLLMGVLLSLIVSEKNSDGIISKYLVNKQVFVVLIFAGVFTIGRYIMYITGLIRSGYTTNPMQTLIWTLSMGICIGIIFILLTDMNNFKNYIKKSIRFGLFIFGLNWIMFLVFMPVMFKGYITDSFLRAAIDILTTFTGSCLAFGLIVKTNKKGLV